ncbi:phosphoserine phosphatase [Sugiyamaella lignohabitans]|uniref:phosphoserine phosphatase n=1 Tax=Sugiyamaella lignohabitans TaxID=796027 RepID=A0A167FP18_9ASCO|nr:phosphoserine phosphatase [Sugiyamaella lignohabitans]ANB15528.1 phosphoserine phosphatase [Sugiyamaella lignohabitans]
MSYVATLISDKGITPSFVDEFETVLRTESATVLRPEMLSDSAGLGGTQAMDFYLDIDSSNITSLKQSLFDLSSKSYGVDIILQPADRESRRDKGLFVFDMDSTLIQQEVIDMIAAYVNVEAEVSKITASAMNGEIDFTESLRQRVALLAGAPADVFDSLKSQIKITPGAKELTRALKKKGVKMAVLSGGFIPLASWLKDQLGLDYAYANNLEVSEDGKTLVGKTYGRIINSTAKADLLKEIAEKENVDLSRVVAVGDGSNDLEMMGVAGYGIAWNAKPLVQQKAPSRLNTKSLQDILYILGYNDKEQKELIL